MHPHAHVPVLKAPVNTRDISRERSGIRILKFIHVRTDSKRERK